MIGAGIASKAVHFGGNVMPRALTVAALCAVLLGVAGCSDDGTKVRNDQTAAAGAGSGSLNEQDLGGPGKTKQLQAAAASYRSYVLGEVTKLRAAATAFTDAVRAGEVSAAKDLYGPSRYSWQTIGPAAALVPGVAAAVDGPSVGWHRLEYLLWAQGATDATVASRLDVDLANLQTALEKVAITPKAMVAGALTLVRSAPAEPYSHTELWDFAARLDGAQAVFRTLTPVLRAKSNVLYNSLLRGFGTATATLTAYRMPSGAYKPYTVVPPADRQRLAAQLAAVAADLAKVGPVLGL